MTTILSRPQCDKHAMVKKLTIFFINRSLILQQFFTRHDGSWAWWCRDWLSWPGYKPSISSDILSHTSYVYTMLVFIVSMLVVVKSRPEQVHGSVAYSIDRMPSLCVADGEGQTWTTSRKQGLSHRPSTAMEIYWLCEINVSLYFIIACVQRGGWNDWT